MAAAPVGPIWFTDRYKAVRTELDESACVMAVAPVSPNPLKDISNSVSVGSLWARRRS